MVILKIRVKVELFFIFQCIIKYGALILKVGTFTAIV